MLEPIIEVRNSVDRVVSIITSPTGGVARADITTAGLFTMRPW